MAKFINSDHLETSLRRVKEYSDSAFNNLEVTLNDNITAKAEETTENILNNIEENYTKALEYEDFVFQTTVFSEQISENLDIKFNQVTESIQLVDNKINDFMSQVNTDIKILNDELSMNKDPYAINISEEGISFTQSNKDIACVRDEVMDVTKLSVTESLGLHGFKFIPRATGNVSLVWDNGVSTISNDNIDGGEE